MKKDSIIKRLLYDDPCSFDTMRVDNEEYWRLWDKVDNLREQIKAKIDGDTVLIGLLKQYEDIMGDITLEEAKTYFERGVKFGVLFGMTIAEEN